MASKTRAIDAASGVQHEVLSYASSKDHFGDHSVQELGADPRGVFKTLVITHGGELAICCVPVAGHLSLKAAAKALGWKKAEMANPAQAQRATGYVVGGISPLGTQRKLPTLIDGSAVELSQIIISAGQRGLSLRLAPNDLLKLTGARLAPIGV
ncbi:Cys-tRNA(Pro) deacylase [uncultured Corynebacterium sp.]|uniref:Cys-tRNA(Pro) deacylase n=1 Tax=uncultured Corynebacterium sp. TaxID=159447 RepID=UPI0025DACA9C|nr:Cys-tRNA(Pro) deacylase [uncultured Corynebacterium sp.]